MRFDNVHWNETDFGGDDRPQFPTILAIGDSWFWYFLPGGSLLNQLGPLVKENEHQILAVGQNGAEAYQYAYGVHEKRIRGILDRHGDVLMAVFISGGGNDFAGFNDLRPLLKENCAGETTAEGCFDKPESNELSRLMEKIYDSYITLIGRVLATCKQESLKIVLHNYDYAYPSRVGALGRPSTWLKAALEDAQVPEHLQRDCLKLVLNQFTEKLEKIVSRNVGRVFLVDSRNTLKEHHWANELHPTQEGFQLIAHEKWYPLLRDLKLADRHAPPLHREFVGQKP